MTKAPRHFIASELHVPLLCQALRNAVHAQPGHVQAEHMLASLAASMGGVNGVSKASPEFVRALFDDFSESFDTQLASLGRHKP